MPILLHLLKTYPLKKIVTLGIAMAVLLPSLHAQQKTLLGFSETSAAKELKTEAAFDRSLSAPHIGETIKLLSSVPHNLGSAGGKAVAETIFNKFKSYGLDTHMATYSVLYPTPKTRILEMYGSKPYKALLQEPALAEDATSSQSDQLPTYNAWSGDGDVTSELVYVNYGLPADYVILDSLGISVKGKIVIARYGHAWRGIKPKVAQEHGAIGCIIYSDPADDGYSVGDVYPKGAFKNEFGVQRGSVMDMVLYPGDPLTPGTGSTKTAKRLDRKDAITILKIPVLPISYHDARPLLEVLDGPVAPESWRGGLPFTYHIGPGTARIHLKMEFNWNQVPAYDVIGMIKGSEFPDELVIRGNHHDAWVNGAGDPISGQAAMDEEAKALGILLKTGWKPKRTLVYCAWDGEEPGLIGSTEWAEEHAAELQQKAVVYINSDGNGRGLLEAEGSHALEGFMAEVSATVIDPETKVSVAERKKASSIMKASGIKAKKEVIDRKVAKLGALGSGSDFSSFLQHLGVPSLNLAYSGEDAGGEYHSIYDSYDDYRRFKDPGFDYGVALASTAGHAALRMADADVLPFDFRTLSATIKGYSTEVIELADHMRANTVMENELIKGGYAKLAADPTKAGKFQVAKAEVPAMDFSSLTEAISRLEKSAAAMALRFDGALKTGGNQDLLNRKLYKAEQQLLSLNGLPRRGWYKHTIYAPGFYTGYGVKTLPGIREALEQRNWSEAEEQIKIVSASINKLAAYLSI